MDQQQPPKEKSPKSKGNNELSNFAKYSGIAFQMIGIILVTTWGGLKLDKLTGLKTPVFTIILSLFGVFAAIYLAIRDFIRFK